MKVPLDPEKMNQDMSNPSLDRNDVLYWLQCSKLKDPRMDGFHVAPPLLLSSSGRRSCGRLRGMDGLPIQNGLEWHQLDLDVYLPCCMVNLPQNQTLISTSGAHSKFQCEKFGYLYPNTFSRWQQKNNPSFSFFSSVFLQDLEAKQADGSRGLEWEGVPSSGGSFVDGSFIEM